MQGRGLERRVAALEEAWGQVRAVGLGGGGRAGPGGAYPTLRKPDDQGTSVPLGPVGI